jgi:sugar O-acyltransferase (sialic acid O-acetyltransferase NeuD family)
VLPEARSPVGLVGDTEPRDAHVRDLLILGVGVHAGEMVEIVERANRVQPTWNLLGIISPDGRRSGETHNGCPVLGSVELLTAYPKAGLVSDNEWPRSLSIPRGRLVSLVDPGTFVSRTARVGVGSVIYPNGFIGLDAEVGDAVFCLSGCVINHHCVLEDRVVVASGVTLAGSVHVEADCYLGQASTVRQYVRIGRGSLIGLGAVVLNDVPPNSVMVGNPARRIRDRVSTISKLADDQAAAAPEQETSAE